MDVGFIGLGAMGLPMARNLLKAGHRVHVYNRTLSRAEPLGEDGAIVARSPAEACAGDAVITMLANDQAAEETVFGENGILKGLKQGAAHISMSTITVALSERLKQAHAEAQQTYIAAPVSDGPMPPPQRSFSSSPPETKVRSSMFSRSSTQSASAPFS